MYKNKVHSVPERIVSIDQPYIRPIVRGKAATPTEFGAKMDLSLDENGMICYFLLPSQASALTRAFSRMFRKKNV